MASKAPLAKIEHKTIQCEIKSIDKKLGKMSGHLAVFGNIDSQGDRIIPGAFKKTIADAYSRKSNKGKKYLLPLLWMHNPDQPIGGYTELREDQKGLYFEADIDVNQTDQGVPLNPLAMMAFSGSEMGFIDEQSIGYKAIQKDYAQDGARELKEIQLWEGSLITMNFASNSEAQVTNVKSTQGKLMGKQLQSKDFSDRYMQECLSDWLYGDFNNLVQALKGSIMDLFMIGDTPDADVLNTVLNSDNVNKIGFVQAVEAYVQKGIDLGASAYLQSQDSSNSSSSMYYMSRGNDMEQKAGRAISKATATTLAGHAQTLQNVADQHKSMQAMMDMQHKMISNVAEDLSSIIDGVAYTGDDQSGQEAAAETDGSKSAGPLNAPTEADLEGFTLWLQSQIASK